MVNTRRNRRNGCTRRGGRRNNIAITMSPMNAPAANVPAPAANVPAANAPVAPPANNSPGFFANLFGFGKKANSNASPAPLAGGRRKGRKGSRKNRKASRKAHRKGSRKSRKASRKNRKANRKSRRN